MQLCLQAALIEDMMMKNGIMYTKENYMSEEHCKN